MKTSFKLNKFGFTLMEMLFVIAVIGILTTIALMNPFEAREKAKFARVTSDLKNIDLTLQNYLVDKGKLPCFDHSFDDGTELSWASEYIRWPTTPWEGQYHLEHSFFGFDYSVSIQFPDVATMNRFDVSIDDGNPATGNFRGNTSAPYEGRGEYVSIPQSPYNHVEVAVGSSCP